MGDCDILLLVVVLASCSTPSPGRMNLLPPTADADTGSGASRRPGDPPLSGAGSDDGGPDAPHGADAPPAATAPDAGASAPDAPAPALAIDAVSPPDTSPPPPDAPALAPDAATARADVGVTWDANLLLTDCGITKPWAPKKSYPKYEFALNYGHIFQCLGEPPNRDLPSPLSDCKSPDYEPGKPGGPWAGAWYDSGVCR